LIANLVMEAFGWQVGGPRAAERATMLTVMFTGNIVAALAGGAMLAAFARATTPCTTTAPNLDVTANAPITDEERRLTSAE
jgi:hypothetical protein